jgi:hypothetical protein
MSKHPRLFFASVASLLSFILFASSSVQAQSKTGADYFAGKWNVLLKGLPDGDTHMFLVLQKTDTAMTGAVQDSTGKEIAKLTKSELKDTVITVYFTAQGYDVNLILTKKDDDHTTGSLMSMFNAEGERVKVAQSAGKNP